MTKLYAGSMSARGRGSWHPVPCPHHGDTLITGMLRCWLESQASDNQAIVQVPFPGKTSLSWGQQPQRLGLCHPVLTQAAETTTEKPRRDS